MAMVQVDLRLKRTEDIVVVCWWGGGDDIKADYGGGGSSMVKIEERKGRGKSRLIYPPLLWQRH
jgi:hypothetical protein